MLYSSVIKESKLNVVTASGVFSELLSDILVFLEFYPAYICDRRCRKTYRCHLHRSGSPNCLNLEEGSDIMSRNVGNYLPIYAA